MSLLSSPRGLIISSLLGQFFVLISIPIVTRIVGINVFGEYTEFLSFVLVFQLLGSLRIETIFLSKDRDKLTDMQLLRSLCFLSLLLTLVFSIVSYVYFKKNLFVVLIFISSFSGNIASIYTYYSLGNEAIHRVSLYRILRPLLLFITQLILLSINVIEYSLEIGFTISIILSVVLSFKIYGLYKIFSIQFFYETLKEGKRYILFSFPSDALNSVGAQLPIVLFANYFGKDIAAYYYTVNKTIVAPYALVTESLSKINMQKFKKVPLEKFLRYLKNLQRSQIMLFLSSYTLLLLFYDQIALFFLGIPSTEIGYVVCAAFPFSLAVFLGVPVLALLSINSRQHVDLIFQCTLFVGRLGGVGLGLFMNSFVVSLFGYFIISSLVYFLFSHKSGRDIGYNSSTYILTALVVIILVVYLKLFILPRRPSIN